MLPGLTPRQVSRPYRGINPNPEPLAQWHLIAIAVISQEDTKVRGRDATCPRDPANKGQSRRPLQSLPAPHR